MVRLLVAGLLVLPVFTHADVIKCAFTEPFISTTYSMAKQTLTITDHSTQTSKVIKNISFQILGPAQFELWDSGKKVVQQIDLNYQGSDGMSERQYPYDVRWASTPGNTLRGGCGSNFLHSKNP